MKPNQILLDQSLKIKKCYHKLCIPVCNKYQITENELEILLFLHYQAPKYDSAKAIIEARSMSKSQVCKSIDGLKANGYLQTTIDQKDRRLIHLALTKKATPIIQEGIKTRTKLFNLLYQDVSEEDINTLKRIIQQIDKNLEKEMK